MDSVSYISSEEQIKHSRAVLEQNRKLSKHVVRYDGFDFVVFPQVFSPGVFNAWKVFSQALLHEKIKGDFLEIGAGSGITGLYLLLKNKINSAVLTDVNPEAIKNSEENIKRFGLISRAQAILSDVFDQIPAARKFDVIYWNYPWIYEESNYKHKDELDKGLFDPGYKNLEKYLRDARNCLKPNGRLFLGFGSFGNKILLEKLCEQYKFKLKKIVEEEGEENGKVKFMLYEIRKN